MNLYYVIYFKVNKKKHIYVLKNKIMKVNFSNGNC